jgi:proton glutamate symport protein
MTSLSIRMLLALIAGLLAGAIIAGGASNHLPALLSVAKPVGKLWLDALTMTVVPLVFSLLVIGVAGVGATTGGPRGLAGRSLIWFAILLLGACAASDLAATLSFEIWPMMPTTALQAAASPQPVAEAGDWLGGFIPSNPIKAAADTAITPLVVFALLFGFAATHIADPLRQSLMTVLRAIVETMLVIVRWVLLIGPIGVFALAFVLSATTGLGAFGVLIRYILLVCGIGALVTLLAYGVAALAGRVPLTAFARAALPAQVVALSTQSSLASLPAMIEAAPNLGVTESRAAVVLPMAVSMFRASSAAMNVAVAIYLAHFHGVALGPGALVVGVLVGAVVSLAAVGLPAQVSFFASIAPICLALGAPLTLLPILLAVESVPDIFRTVGNVTSDLAVTRIVGADTTAI